MTFPRNAFGILAMTLGALALMLACLHIFGGPLDPQPRAHVTVGEMAAKIGKAAVRDALGISQEAPQRRPWTLDRWVEIGIAMAAAMAVITAGIGLVRRESRAALAVGAALGLTAIGLKFAMLVVLMLCGLLLVWIVLQFMTELIPWA